MFVMNQVVITFTQSEKYELQNMMDSFKVQNKDKEEQGHKHSFSREDIEFKENLVNFIKSKKNDLMEKTQYINRIKQFLQQQGCLDIGEITLSQSVIHSQLYDGLQKLHTKIMQNAKNREVFQLFIAFIQEMKNLKEEQIYEFQYKLSKANKLNRMEKEVLAYIAKKIVKVQKWTKMNDIQDQLSSFFTKIIHYGSNQVHNQIEKISSLQIRNKSYRLVEYLQNNCIQLKKQSNPALSLVNKLTNSIYDKHQIQQTLSELPENIKTVLQPVCFEFFKLRQQNKGYRSSEQILSLKNVNELQLKQQCQIWKHKSQCYECQLKKVKLILQKFSYLNNLFKEQSLYQQIQTQLTTSSQQLKMYLQRIYNHLKDYEEVAKGKKMSFVQRKDKEIQFLQQKLRNALQELDILKQAKNETLYEQSLLLTQNSLLKKDSCQKERVMDEYYREMNNLNAEINHHHNQITDLSKQVACLHQKIVEKEHQIDELQKRVQELLQGMQNIKNINKKLQASLKQSIKQNDLLKNEKLVIAHQNREFQVKYNQLKNQKIQLLKQVNNFRNSKEQVCPHKISNLQTYVQTQFQAMNAPQGQKKNQCQDKAQLQKLRLQIESLKQQRIFRINQQKQMKRIYREERQEINKVNICLQEYREKYQILLKQNNRLKNGKQQGCQKNQRLKGELRERANIQRLEDEYKILHNNFQELKKFNDLLKSQNTKLKLQGGKQKELVLKNKVKQLQTKITILQQQNLELKVSMHITTKTNNVGKQKISTFNIPTNDKSDSTNEAQLLRSEINEIKMRNEQQRIKMIKQLKIKQELISTQRIEMLKLQQKLHKITPNK